ncbi:septum site-determining protein MinC [Methylobacillus rhizosphaerae]|uniref:Probable septum site-determining protein MinC n=1 Tax=Methylobacillus rhizosphaerae TaxID=551994 RepID=A0A238XUN3_9PROT|nr:septum site-determining protein MinC [Methylobacillus rhizosphaerae]SNR62044.1 septum site-determining protein MinC [Methylobacillus rhizosphaerae]
MSKIAATASDTPAFDLKGSTFPMLILYLYSTDLSAIEQQVQARMLSAPDLFSYDPVVLDMSKLGNQQETPDYAAIRTILHSHKLVLVGVANAGEEHAEAAQKVGLGLFNGGVLTKPRVAEPAPVEEAPQPPAEPVAISRVARIITSPVRTGQQIYAKGGDLIVLAPVSAGAEVLADGNIHVYASLRGRALAGARGDESARIFIRSMEAELISIAGSYKAINEELSREMHGKAVQAYLVDEQLRIEVMA